MNEAEELVAKLCRKSFLSLWSYPNPKGKDNKELCDLLVVCEPDVIIFSVKEIKLPETGDITVDWARWHRKAVEESCNQIYGAERWINRSIDVITNEGETAISFPEASKRRIHRVAVALGSKGQVPIKFGDFGRGFIHVFDEISLDVIMSERDTISDFVKYLSDKEEFYQSKKTVFFEGEESLLTIYLKNNCSFPSNYDMVIIDGNIWGDFRNSEQYKAKKEADKISYVWDNLIETLCQDFFNDNLETDTSLHEIELATRIMAKENRFYRRILGKSLIEFLHRSKLVRSRLVPSPSGIQYVFLACARNEERQYRYAELSARCHVVRGLSKDSKIVVGIATETFEQGKGFSLDVIYLHKENWTTEDQRQMEYLQKECGFYANPMQTSVSEDEYPDS